MDLGPHVVAGERRRAGDARTPIPARCVIPVDAVAANLSWRIGHRRKKSPNPPQNKQTSVSLPIQAGLLGFHPSVELALAPSAQGAWKVNRMCRGVCYTALLVIDCDSSQSLFMILWHVLQTQFPNMGWD